MAPEDTRPPRPTRRAGEPVAAFSARIDKYVEDVRAMQRTLPNRHTREVVTETVEKVVYRDHPAAAMLDELETKKTNLDRAIEEAKAKEPPPEIADLLDPDLTTRQNLEKLIEKHTKAKHLEEIARSHGDASGAMRHLKDAERLESGINWNRARLAEVI